MKSSKILFTAILCIFATVVFSQTPQDSSIVTIKTKEGGNFRGKIVFESPDTLRLETEHFGIVSLPKNTIVYENLVSVIMNDDNEFIGQLVKEDALTITLKTDNLGTIAINKKDIKSRKAVETEQIKKGDFWFPNPQSTRYFWSPNGYGLKKGEGYYQNIWVLWNQFAYGVTDNISIGAGVIPVFLFGGPTPVFGTAKFSIPVVENKFNVGGGAILGTVLGDGTSLGIMYGIATLGSTDSNVTFGMGYGYADGGWANAPAISFSGMFRISKKGYILTENYLLSGDSDTGVIVTIGGRSIIRKAALDYGLVIPLGVDAGIALPWLGMTIPFGDV